MMILNLKIHKYFTSFFIQIEWSASIPIWNIFIKLCLKKEFKINWKCLNYKKATLSRLLNNKKGNNIDT